MERARRTSLVLIGCDPKKASITVILCGSIKSRPIRGVRREKVFFSLFLRNNKTIKCLKHCVRFELTTEDPTYKAFEGKGTNTYERDEKKKEKKKMISSRSRRRSFLLPCR
jgi:hypothetical protein